MRIPTPGLIMVHCEREPRPSLPGQFCRRRLGIVQGARKEWAGISSGGPRSSCCGLFIALPPPQIVCKSSHLIAVHMLSHTPDYYCLVRFRGTIRYAIENSMQAIFTTESLCPHVQRQSRSIYPQNTMRTRTSPHLSPDAVPSRHGPIYQLPGNKQSSQATLKTVPEQPSFAPQNKAHKPHD